MHQIIQKFAVFSLAFLLSIGGVLVITSSSASAQGTLTPRSEMEETDKRTEDNDDEDIDVSGDNDELPVPVLFGVPVDEIHSSFGDPRGGGSRSHEGLDMLAPAGTPVVSPTDAEIERIGSWSGAGQFVITQAGGEEFRYFHLADQASYLDEGEDIEAGDLIGFVGSSGNATADTPHLHLEIRDDGEPIDPYPRVTQDFTLEEKMDILANVFGDVRDEEELAEFLADKFASVFTQANLQNTEIPEEVAEELPESSTDTSLPSRDLSVGSRGAGVTALQSRLIAEGFLDINNPTGYFGPLTKTALAEYQQANGIDPASGYYGPITRSQMTNASDSNDAGDDTENMSREDMLDRINTLQEQLDTLQAQVGAQ